MLDRSHKANSVLNAAKRFSFLAIILFVAACAADNESTQTGGVNGSPYAVGSTTRFIHDSSRGYDSVAGIDDGIRILIAEIWYPVSHAVIAEKKDEFRRATYGDYVFGDREMHRLMMTNTTFFHMTPETVREGVTESQIDAAIEELFKRKRESFVDAPLARGDDPWPVIVMTHGDAGSRYNMESVCEYLAAHGYVVIAPEHTGNSPYSLTGRDPALDPAKGDPEIRDAMAAVVKNFSSLGAYGSDESYGQSYAPSSTNLDPVGYLRQLDRSLLQRLNDLRATLDELERMNDSGFSAGRPGALAVNRIGLIGRSFGGASTLVGMAMEPRITAGFAVVPPGWTDPRSSLPADQLAAAGEESVILAQGGDFPLTTITKPAVVLSGAEDALIIGLGAQVASTAGAAAPAADDPHPIMRQTFESTDAPVVWGMLADSNHATFGVSGGYWWPELKPNTQTRYFDPDTEFELISPAIAHKMQKELALAFFDLFIRGDQYAEADLREIDYQDQGLTLELRNF